MVCKYPENTNLGKKRKKTLIEKQKGEENNNPAIPTGAQPILDNCWIICERSSNLGYVGRPICLSIIKY